MFVEKVPSHLRDKLKEDKKTKTSQAEKHDDGNVMFVKKSSFSSFFLLID